MQTLLMFVNGGAMRGGPLHHLLGGATLVAEVATQPRYKFWSVRDEFPALQPLAGRGGVAVPGELYEVSYDILDRLLDGEPAELELGVVHLQQGFGSLAMVLRSGYVDAERELGLIDISEAGGWRAYLAGKGET
ncbi:allophanate hydrolase-related protein [Nonomuraea rubra]|uniref:allophanate hydrolase-related protein n=1 Tax=Nonomuraea rubra TaxID=46180 RepID=UPI003404739C